MPEGDLVIVGGGLSGLIAAGEALSRGLETVMISKSPGGSLPLSWGGLDLLGRDYFGQPAENPFEAIKTMARLSPGHPYAAAGLGNLARGVEILAELSGDETLAANRPNRRIAALTGELREIYWAPESLLPEEGSAVLVAGFEPWWGFAPLLLKARLAKSLEIARIEAVRLKALGYLPHSEEPSVLAAALDKIEAREKVIAEIKKRAAADLIIFPAVIGLNRSEEAKSHLREALGSKIGEIFTPLPSIAGLRLQKTLASALLKKGLRLIEGFKAARMLSRGNIIERAEIDAPSGTISVKGKSFILATGGFSSGGLKEDGGKLVEPLLGLPVEAPPGELFGPRFFSRHPIRLAGIRVDGLMRPVDEGGRPVFDNLRAAGSMLAGADRLHEKSRGGVSLATGAAAARSVEL
ncbi:MAG: anaerobic glycerol-3-phosphate dehydrogenase subunit B [Deltaproteobacteria bacterium]|nr:anaerobic glycerol-3-phosphate dehydrogenase subunit B [Deltaproteobacteria bacterium]